MLSASTSPPKRRFNCCTVSGSLEESSAASSTRFTWTMSSDAGTRASDVSPAASGASAAIDSCASVSPRARSASPSSATCARVASACAAATAPSSSRSSGSFGTSGLVCSVMGVSSSGDRQRRALAAELHVDRIERRLLGDLDERLARELEAGEEAHHDDGGAPLGLEELG